MTCRAQIDVASVEVRFNHLSISAEVAVGARGEPTVLNAYRNQFEVFTAEYSNDTVPCAHAQASKPIVAEPSHLIMSAVLNICGDYASAMHAVHCFTCVSSTCSSIAATDDAVQLSGCAAIVLSRLCYFMHSTCSSQSR